MNPLVGIVMGSDSDWPVMQAAAEMLKEFGVPFEAKVVSAHRTPDLLFDYAAMAQERDLRAIIAGAAFGKLPFVMRGIELEAVGVNDAARALILAAEKGRVGERYLISDKMISNAEVARIAAETAGVPAPARSIPLPVTYLLAAMGTIKGRLRRTDERLSLASLRLMRAEAPVDHGKAVRELGWHPTPVEESIREAARFWVGLRKAKRKTVG